MARTSRPILRRTRHDASFWLLLCALLLWACVACRSGSSLVDPAPGDIPPRGEKPTSVDAPPRPVGGSAAPEPGADVELFESDDLESDELAAEDVLANRVRDALEEDPELDAEPIRVVVRGNDVHLRGTVPSDVERKLAERIVEGVEGVDRVIVTDLRVESSSTGSP